MENNTSVLYMIVKEYCSKEKIALYQLAYRAGISAQYLSMLLHGKRKLSKNAAESLAGVIGVNPLFLLGSSDYARPASKNDIDKKLYDLITAIASGYDLPLDIPCDTLSEFIASVPCDSMVQFGTMQLSASNALLKLQTVRAGVIALVKSALFGL